MDPALAKRRTGGAQGCRSKLHGVGFGPWARGAGSMRPIRPAQVMAFAHMHKEGTESACMHGHRLLRAPKVAASCHLWTQAGDAASAAHGMEAGLARLQAEEEMDKVGGGKGIDTVAGEHARQPLRAQYKALAQVSLRWRWTR